MGNSKWLVVAGLALVAAFAPACKTKCEEVDSTKAADGEVRPTTSRLMSASPGVVEIFRGCELVGYVSVDPEHAEVSWWLLKVGVEPPVMPHSGEWLDEVTWRLTNVGRMNGDTLCASYGGFLQPTASQVWRLTREAPTLCLGSSKPKK